MGLWPEEMPFVTSERIRGKCVIRTVKNQCECNTIKERNMTVVCIIKTDSPKIDGLAVKGERRHNRREMSAPYL